MNANLKAAAVGLLTLFAVGACAKGGEAMDRGCPGLPNLDPATAEADAKHALAAHDSHLLGVNGYATELPGVDDRDAEMARKIGVKTIPGTSDAPAGPVCAKRNAKARRYAEIYNRTILNSRR